MKHDPVARDGEAILEATGISLRFGGLEALHKLSFSVPRRQIISIIGPNGAGKTSLLNAITGIYGVDDGEISFRKRPITRLRAFQIAELGIARTFQQCQLFQNMTVLENVMVGMHPRTRSGFLSGMLQLSGERRERKEMREKAEILLARFGLSVRAGGMAGHLSMADQKRLEMCRAIAGDPEILLLDEPVAGLNVRETEEMGELILALKGMGHTILLVEHSMHLVMAISDRVIVLHHGSKIGEGPPEAVRTDARVVEAYLGA